MYTIKQPSKILFGKNSACDYDFPKNPLLITSYGAKKRGWISYLNLDSSLIFEDSVRINLRDFLHILEIILSKFLTPASLVYL